VPITPIYGLPYPALSDPPNGPAQFQALAEAVEHELQRIDADVDTLQATDSTINGQISVINANIAGNGRLVTAAGVINTTSGTTELDIPKLAIENWVVNNGFWYILNLKMSAQASAGGDSYLVRIRKDTALSGTVIAQFEWITQVAGFTHSLTQHIPWQAPATDGDADFYVSVQRIAGTGVLAVNGLSATAFWIDVKGSTPLFVNVA
jgi:hypothetical protein